MYIAEQITRLRNELPEGVNLLAISKYQPIEALQEAYDAGQRMFGENHIQEAVSRLARRCAASSSCMAQTFAARQCWAISC